MISTFALALGLCLAPVATPQEPDERPWFRVEGETYVIQPTAARQGPTLEELVAAVRERLDLTILVPEPQDCSALGQTRFTFEGAKRVPRAQLYDFFQILLRTHGFACVEIGTEPVRVVQIVRLLGQGIQTIKAALNYVPIEAVDQYANRPASLIMTLMPLERLEPTQAQTMLQRFFSAAQLEGFAPYGGPQDETKGLMIIGFGPTVVAIKALLTSAEALHASGPSPSAASPPAPPLVHLQCEVWRVRGEEERALAERTGTGNAAIESLRTALHASALATRDLHFHGIVPLDHSTKLSETRPLDGTGDDGFSQRDLSLRVARTVSGFSVAFAYTSSTRGRRALGDTLQSETIAPANAWRAILAGSDELLVVLTRVRPAE